MSLEQLRALLHAPIDMEHDFEGALKEAARRAREALAASRALVAVPDGEGWRAHADTGEVLEAALVGLIASIAVIRRAFEEGPALECVTLKEVRRSGSLDGQRIHSVLAMPLWRVGDAGRPGARPIGVLYLDRRDDLHPFTDEDREWAIDFAALTARTLTLMELLAQTRRQRDAARLEAADLRGVQAFGTVDVLESRDPAFRELMGRALTGVMRSPKVTVLLVGPTGSGKSHLARRLHAIGPRREQPFVTLDCGQATSSEALSAELFGFARKSGFAVDVGGRPGKALLADGGVLFIDEVNSMPLDLQPRLLRLVEAGHYSALGSGEEVRVDLQIIAAANEDLRLAVRERRFREDLYFRLSQMSLTLPPLSGRRADVVPLAERMLAQVAREQGDAAAAFLGRGAGAAGGFRLGAGWQSAWAAAHRGAHAADAAGRTGPHRAR
jgi:transcriptional regulator with GAF, ATPase, and Fis domain